MAQELFCSQKKYYPVVDASSKVSWIVYCIFSDQRNKISTVCDQDFWNIFRQHGYVHLIRIPLLHPVLYLLPFLLSLSCSLSLYSGFPVLYQPLQTRNDSGGKLQQDQLRQVNQLSHVNCININCNFGILDSLQCHQQSTQ